VDPFGLHPPLCKLKKGEVIQVRITQWIFPAKGIIIDLYRNFLVIMVLENLEPSPQNADFRP
jgi:hypothetical protein